jgi:redox-sensitive bicupin YhaK (pirin superfamily)
VSDLDVDPPETEGRGRAVAALGAVAEYFEPREVPLGGIRGVTVRRLLPQRKVPTVGAWCFLDQMMDGHSGPHNPPLKVLPHPHIGLQTVTWPFEGEIRHRDSIGSDVVVQPRQLNLMTAGRGIAHSEFAVEDAPAGHGLQLWTALPAEALALEPSFEQHRKLPLYERPGLRAIVILGTLDDVTSPATAYTPIVGADLRINPGAEVTIPLKHYFEHAVLVIDGDLTISSTHFDNPENHPAAHPLTPGPLLYLGDSRSDLTFASRTGAHVILLGGEPFREDIVMWWNFVGRSHEDIAQAREDWQNRDLDRFPDIAGHDVEERIAAPPLPGVRLKPRGRGR